MKANAPEKIYLEKYYPDNGVLPNGLNYNQSPNDIEYTRTDAFIEKATQFLKDKGSAYITIIDGQLILRKGVVKDFRKYMKGE